MYGRFYFAAVRMDASIVSGNALSASSSLLRSVRPLLISRRVCYLGDGHRFRRRVSGRLWSSSDSEPRLLHSQGELKERRSKRVAVGDGWTGGSASTFQDCVSSETETTEDDEASGDLGRGEAAEEELKSTAFRDVEPSFRGRRGKREQFVGRATKRLQSDEEDVGFMRAALVEARNGAKTGEVPVGAVLVHNKKIIARFHNRVEAIGDPTAHAEMLCIRSAAAQLGGWRLTDVSMYVTLEPCPMCAGAILQGRVSEVVWGARNSLLGADGSWIKLFPVSSSGECGEPEGKNNLHPFHRTITVRRGVLAEECAEIMQSFFALRRLQPKCRIDDAHVGVRFLGWFSPAIRKLNSWVSTWLQR